MNHDEQDGNTLEEDAHDVLYGLVSYFTCTYIHVHTKLCLLITTLYEDISAHSDPIRCLSLARFPCEIAHGRQGKGVQRDWRDHAPRATCTRSCCVALDSPSTVIQLQAASSLGR